MVKVKTSSLQTSPIFRLRWSLPLLLLLLFFPLKIEAAPNFASPAFATNWNRLDKAVQEVPGVGRGYTWGPQAPGAEPIASEPYGGGTRTVQYFDKARMEINNPAGDPNNLFYVTTGLLVKELATGLRQDGDTTFTAFPPSQVQVAGDSNEGGKNQLAPTYASFKALVSGDGQPDLTGQSINTTIDRAGTTSVIPQLQEIRLLKAYAAVTRHNVADVFVDFGNLNGPVWDGSQFVTGSVFFGNPLYVLGRPVSEPYWITTELNGVSRPVLVQLFERRALTYTPSNPDPYKVEMGNVGQHYYRWRYIENAPAAPTPTAVAPTPPPTATPIVPPSGPAPYGLNLLQNLYSLPQSNAYAQSFEVSSHDPAGGNVDFGNVLYRENTSYTIFDDYGSGVVTRIWMTHYPNQDFSKIGRIQFYLDESPRPTVDMAIEDFFSGKKAPFLAPLVGNYQVSSGGYFSYLPVSYNRRLKIVTTGQPGYYQINYQKLSGVAGVPSFTGQEDYSQVLNYLVQPGVDPKPILPGRQTLKGSGQLSPNNELELGSLQGPAAISSVRLKLNISDPNLITRLYFRIQYEGRAKPQVEAPFDYFFGSGLNEKDVNGLMVGMDPGTHEYYCYFPMPFHQQARLSVFNASGNTVPLSWEIGYDPDPNGLLVNANSGYFNATFNSQRETPEGQDYQLLNVTGRGRYVGTVLHFYGHYSMAEGDDRVYVDGSNTPRLYGTGLEDYFNGAYGFNRGKFSLPLHGSPFKYQGDEENIDMVGYRFLLADALNFNSALRVGFEQGYIGQDKPTPGQVYSSLAFWYGLDDANLVPTDELHVANTASAPAHGYSATGVDFRGSLTSFFEGQQDKFQFTDSGYNLKGSSQFKLNIVPDNAGVVLRRRFDYGGSNQQATVYVDDQEVGRWFSSGRNLQKRWREEDFVIPAEFTRGKSSLSIRMVPIVQPSPWTEYYYAAFAIKPR